ncbi:MAG TPA: single-stranded-DNA-specific exonuclease RecJ [Verrucomicrobiae bacterium]|nr:single-stranded-DNA-specific exonuclease RecJ [Verrucomicrobiae bacterium]
MKRWVIAPREPALTETLARELSLAAPLAQVLVNRGFRDADAASRFLNPQLRQLGDPFDLPQMAPAVDRILQATEGGERIVIYGDYDVDGVTSSALLQLVLRAAGATVANFLPHRMDEGYGLTADGIARCLKEHKPQLLIAVDCGTGSVREIADLKKHKVDTIVLDHHEPGEKLPDCIALVNPKIVGRASRPPRSEENHGRDARATPFASVGVSFKLAHALLKRDRRLSERIDLRDHLDLVAVGTVADVVPLTGENRILVKTGLERLPHTQKIGLRALMDIAGVPDEVSPHHIGFRIGPRLNAAGRLSDAMTALELLLTDDAARAREMAAVLDEHNAERQRIEEGMVEEAMAMARAREGDRVLVLAKEGWHVGVIGIVASRVQQEFYKPTVVIGIEENLGKGSCRSVIGFSIVEALQHCAPLLERFGGHEMAAGLSVKAGKIDELRRKLNEFAATALKDEDLSQRVRIDAVATLADFDAEFFAQLDRFEPCGPENPTPVFAVEGVRLRGAPRVVGKNHLRFSVTDGETTAEAIWWGRGDFELPQGNFDVAFTPEINEYRGVENVQLKVKDVRNPL